MGCNPGCDQSIHFNIHFFISNGNARSHHLKTVSHVSPPSVDTTSKLFFLLSDAKEWSRLALGGEKKTNVVTDGDGVSDYDVVPHFQ
jgi:hypothetical protein